MLTCGIDVGARTIKAVLARDGRVVGRATHPAGMTLEDDVEQALAAALAEGAISRSAVDRFVATGSGRQAVTFAHERPTSVTCAARGVFAVLPQVRTVIDVGAEEGRALRCEEGKVRNFVINDKCAAGAGAFMESMARALDVSLDDFGPLALTSATAIAMNAQCVVFAESEVVSLVHAQTPPQDIARAICEAIAGRVASMVRQVGHAEPVGLIGGVARNSGFVRALEDNLKLRLLLPPEPDFVAALGSALCEGTK